MTTTKEIAREIKGWTKALYEDIAVRGDGRCTAHAKDKCHLCLAMISTAFTSALAASEQRAFGLQQLINEKLPEYVAKFQASKRAAEGCGPHHSYRGTPVDCEEYEGLCGQALAQLQAIGRALERVMEAARIVHASHCCDLPNGKCLDIEDFGLLSAALASGSPQEGK